MTCTPYGINSHRLLVTGKRVPLKQVAAESIDDTAKRQWWQAIAKIIAAGLALIIFIILMIRTWHKYRPTKSSQKKFTINAHDNCCMCHYLKMTLKCVTSINSAHHNTSMGPAEISLAYVFLGKEQHLGRSTTSKVAVAAQPCDFMGLYLCGRDRLFRDHAIYVTVCRRTRRL